MWLSSTLDRTAVVIVDDHEIVRQGLKSLIDAVPGLAVIGEADTGATALQCIGRAAPDVMVLDLELPDMSGLDVLRRVRKAFPHVRVLVCSSCPADSFSAPTLRAGASAYVCKSAGTSAFLDALRIVVASLKVGPPQPKQMQM